MKWYNSREACQKLGVHPNTLRKWDKLGKITTMRTASNQRRYDLSPFIEEEKKVTKQICYCRVSSAKQRDDLERQVNFMKEKFPKSEVVTDVGSGVNFKRKGLKTILERAMSGEQLEVVVAYKDRLARFGWEIIKHVIEFNGGRVLVLQEVALSPERELTQDLLTILHVFSCRMHGLRSYRDKIKEDKALSNDNTEEDFEELD